MKIPLGAISILILACLVGCSAAITRHGYDISDAQVNRESCPDIAIKCKASFSEEVATVLGRIEAEDSGFSTDCSEAYVLDIFRKDACMLGAHVINITDEAQPGLWSTCYRAKAEFLRFKDETALASIKSDPQYVPDLINLRSQKTAAMNAAVIGGGIVGGAVGGLAATALASGQNSSEWRLPVPSDLGGESEWRKNDAESYLIARGDFDGDGENDTASLLISDKANKIGLFVKLASQKSGDAPLLLESRNGKQTIKTIGVKSAPPDKYTTACGKGHLKCKTDEPPEIQINHPAIDLFQYEGASSFFVWDRESKNFGRIWISD